jgi:hypothetical protein
MGDMQLEDRRILDDLFGTGEVLATELLMLLEARHEGALWQKQS